MKDCYDGDCVLVLTKPTTVPLDGKKLGYPSIRVTAISTEKLTFTVRGSEGGSTTMSFGPGIGNGKLGISATSALEVGLTTVDGKPALVLQLGPAA